MTGPRAEVAWAWGWRSMWIIAMFDLPTDTPAARKAYARFRKTLIEDGFTMMQYSVYIRHCASAENADIHTKRMGVHVPAEGEVRFLALTDRQFGRMEVFVGKKRRPPANAPSKLEFF